jgi:hypothetical protein
MAAKQGEKGPLELGSDWWLWPSAFLLATAGWGQAVWMWENIDPQGLAPLWLLLWVGLGVSGATLAVYWLVSRWWPAAWLAVIALAAVPTAIEMARQYDEAVPVENAWLHEVSPLLVLLLLGVGFSGALMSVMSYLRRRWPGEAPNVRPLREALWCGLFVVFCGLLFISRAFSMASAVLLGGSLVLIESYFVVREATPVQGEGHRA